MIQNVVDTLYRNPKAFMKHVNRFGGYLNYRRMLLAMKEMQISVNHLPIVSSNPNGKQLYFLTGKKYFYQTLFCIVSLTRCTQFSFEFVLVDDGSMDDDFEMLVRKHIQGVKIYRSNDIEQRLIHYLPTTLYPNIVQKRKVYPHIKKLTDIHCLTEEPSWKLVLDSDMLFWNNPDELLEWLKNPEHPIYMNDCVESYGYSTELMTTLAGSAIPKLVNVGVIGLNSENIDWNKIDQWIGALEKKEGTSYYLEQALTAMIIGSGQAHILSKNAYIVNPTFKQVEQQNGVLHHYVDLSKEAYFKIAWKKI
ncbi:glycosyltransferase family 2 protein [Pedobacter sandarakinus]|uniref:glycosyltransferase family 2 protein n=1 Tax=Pedobacter sandarakinus TaxID=353156 RepID=UPI00224501EF|nr:glycosyltransferase family A protein [Pedobacter sandarakinus]MCX2575917.1 glycosyltransferase family A protein [Pedobacter sandarakinus]